MSKKTTEIIITLTTFVLIIATLFLISKNNISEYSVATIKNSQIINYGTDEKNDTSAVMFEAGSNGKMIAAYICLKLADEGKLSLDDNITPYLTKNWITDDKRFSDITIRDLLSHRAGFSPSFEFGVDKKIYFTPGSHFCYSGVGYIYLQQIIENVTGDTLENAARTYVFSPLHMDNSTFNVKQTETPYLSSSSFVLYTCLIWALILLLLWFIGFIIGLITKFKFYSKIILFYVSIAISFVVTGILQFKVLPRMIVPFLIIGVLSFAILYLCRKSKTLKYLTFIQSLVTFILLGMLIPTTLPIGPSLPCTKANAAYSMVTCTKDMTLFAQELISIYNDSSINNNSNMKEFFTTQIIIDEKNSWAAGCAIEKDDSNTTYWHSGINPGMQSLFIINPEKKNAVIVMTNSDKGLDFAKEIAQSNLSISGTWDIVRTDLSNLD